VGRTLAVAVAFLLAGCAGATNPGVQHVPPDVNVQVAESAAGTPAATVRPALDEVLWAVTTDPASDAPLTVTRRYPTDTTRLTASVLATNLSAGSVVEAAWSYNDTSLDAFTTEVVVADAAARRWLSFHLERASEEPWPPGVYAVELSLDGIPAGQSEVEVGDEQ
jgi:hypothetical protein